MKKNCMVAVCGILGFKSLVTKSNLDDVVEHIKTWIINTLYHSIHQNEIPDKTPTLADIQNNDLLGVELFSDTIFLYTKHDSIECYQKLCETVGWLVYYTMFDSFARIRCGISYGEAYIDRAEGLFVGKSIIEANVLEKNQLWSGGAFTKNAERKIPPHAMDEFEWWTVPYNVPVKDNRIKSNLAVNWTQGLHRPHQLTLDWSEDSHKPLKQFWQRTPDICNKWKNTRKFHKEVCKYCNL